MVAINHGKGWYTLYAHIMDGGTYVEAGDEISEGQVIAGVGNTGVGTGPHLHFEMYQNVKSNSDFLQKNRRANFVIDPTSIPDLQKYLFGTPAPFTIINFLNLIPRDNTRVENNTYFIDKIEPRPYKGQCPAFEK